MESNVARKAVAEFIGTALLLIAVVGSGIMAQRLSPTDEGLQLFEAAVATGFALMAIIVAIGPVSGAHINPAVTLVDYFLHGLGRATALWYLAAQFTGAFVGTVVANLMFDLDAISISETSRSGAHLWLGEFVATFGLLLVIFGAVRSGRAGIVAFAVGAWIGGAYFFTSSTSFANPAVTVARMFTDTFAGIAPASVPGFLVAELIAVVVAIPTIRFLYPDVEKVAPDVVVPH